METPTHEQLAKVDLKGRKAARTMTGKSADPDARMTKMKDGRTHLARKAEHAVDLETGAVVAVTLQPATDGDTRTGVRNGLPGGENICETARSASEETLVNPEGPAEIVLDKGYHTSMLWSA
jgi:transposase